MKNLSKTELDNFWEKTKGTHLEAFQNQMLNAYLENKVVEIKLDKLSPMSERNAFYRTVNNLCQKNETRS